MQKETNKIPKIIHYVWVGDKPKPDSVLKNIDSWKKHCPDYTIKEWGNEEHDKCCIKFSKEAFILKKWAFVADYLRIYALYQEGGIYLDSDVELTANLDCFLDNDFFTGFEQEFSNSKGMIGSFLIGSIPQHKIINDWLNYYKKTNFIGIFENKMTPNTTHITKYFRRKLKRKEFNVEYITKVSDKSIIYPYYYFSCKMQDKANYAIHHFTCSWIDSHKRKNLLNLFNKYIIATFKGDAPIDEKNAKLPLYENERILKVYKFYGKKKLVIIKKSK